LEVEVAFQCLLRRTTAMLLATIPELRTKGTKLHTTAVQSLRTGVVFPPFDTCAYPHHTSLSLLTP
jgi:hypothetical protein